MCHGRLEGAEQIARRSTHLDIALRAGQLGERPIGAAPEGDHDARQLVRSDLLDHPPAATIREFGLDQCQTRPPAARRFEGSFVSSRFGDNSKSVDSAQHGDERLAYLWRLHRYQHCRIRPLTCRQFVRRVRRLGSAVHYRILNFHR